MENILSVIGFLVFMAIGIYIGLWLLKRNERKRQERALMKLVYPPLTPPTTLKKIQFNFMGRKDNGFFGVLRMLNRKRKRVDYHV